MNSNFARVLLISIAISIFIISIMNIQKLTKPYSISDDSIADYITDLWVNFDEDDTEKYSQQQLVVISIVAYEAEVNNGGLRQFFANSSRLFAPLISENLKLISANKHKAHFDKFIKQNSIDINDLNSFMSEDVDAFIEQCNRYPFDDFDMKFYDLEETEKLYDLVIEYAKDNYDEVFTNIMK